MLLIYVAYLKHVDMVKSGLSVASTQRYRIASLEPSCWLTAIRRYQKASGGQVYQWQRYPQYRSGSQDQQKYRDEHVKKSRSVLFR